MKSTTQNRKIALLTLRLLLGFIFLMQGWGKVYSIGVENIYQSFFATDAYAGIPNPLLYATAYYTSYVELIAGALVLLGWQRDYALYALASVLVIVTFGHGYAEPIWNLSHVMYRSMLLIPLLLLPRGWDVYSLDFYLKKTRTKE